MKKINIGTVVRYRKLGSSEYQESVIKEVMQSASGVLLMKTCHGDVGPADGFIVASSDAKSALQVWENV